MSLKKDLTAVIEAAFELIEEAPVSQERRRLEIGFEKARVSIEALTCCDDDNCKKECDVTSADSADDVEPQPSEGVAEQIENEDTDSGVSPSE